jgi:hypothetical protein
MKNIIVRSKNVITGGLFGCVLNYIFRTLPLFEEENIDKQNIYWDISTIYYGNIFPNILAYENMNNYETIKDDENTEILDLIDITVDPPSDAKKYHLGNDFIELNKLFFKYFTIPQDIMNVLNTYDLTNYLGVHYRGTNKSTDIEMNDPISIDEFKIIIDSYIIAHNITHVFLSTDEGEILNYLTKKHANTIITTARDLNRDLFWQTPDNYMTNAREAMIDMLCLSKCNTIIKTSSALSAYAKVMNPNINIYRINASIYIMNDICIEKPYFPDSYIPLLECNENYSVECNEILRKKQEQEPKLLEKYKNCLYVEL